MCGRYVSPEEAEIERAWHIGRHNNNPFRKRYNTTPTSTVPILLTDGGDGLTLADARWGFIPSWWKEVQPPRATINARIEGVTSKPMWRQAFAHSRCLVPACGWYEWTVTESVDPDTGEVKTVKQPHFLYVEERPTVAFAGLYAIRPDDTGHQTLSMAILTRPACGAAAQVHDRMPVVLAPDSELQWLNAHERDHATLLQQLQEAAIEGLTHHAVSRRVNSPRHDDAKLIAPVADSCP